MDAPETRSNSSIRDERAAASIGAGPAGASSLPSTVFFTATWFILGIAGSAGLFRDPGTFWHLLVGERILTEGLPHQDWLTFTFGGRPWIAHQWLAELAMALLRHFGGWDALLVVAASGLALLFTWLFGRLVAAGVQVRWAVLFAVLGILTSAGSLHLRPLLLSMGFVGLTFAALQDVERGRVPIRQLTWLVPLFILWVNFHGGALGGMAMLAVAAALWMCAWATGQSSPVRGRRDAVQLAVVVAGAAVTPLVNPYGLEMVRTWLAILRSPVVAESIQEHQSVWRTGSWHVLPLAVLYLVVLVAGVRHRWNATSLLPLVWLALALQHVRHAPLFAITAVLAFADLLPRSSVVAWLARRRIEVCGALPAPPRLAKALLVGPALALALAGLHQHATGRSFAGPERGKWPFSLVPQIAAIATAAGPGTPILNDMTFGGFLPFTVPEVRTLGDDRCELYGDGFLRGWFTGRPEWFAEWVNRYDVRIALATRGTPLDAYLRAAAGWREAAGTPSSALFIRDAPAPRRPR